MDETVYELDDVTWGRRIKGIQEGRGADRWEGERAGAPVPVVPSPPASCHQEIGNAADEDTPNGKRSNDDSSHNPSTHRQIGNGQLLRLFWGMRERERERGPCDALKGLPTTLPTVSVRVHRTLMCDSIFPARSFLLYFRSDHPTVRLIPPHRKVNMSHPGSPHLNISASLGFPSNLSTSHTYLLTCYPTLAPPTGFFLPQLMTPLSFQEKDEVLDCVLSGT